jgi:F0F1-type ATP synthase epsilon subunit
MRQDASTGQMVEDKNATAEQAAAADSKKPMMHIKVYAPFKVYYEGEGYSITAVNESGPFDILPKHHNFLCMLLPCDLVIQTPYETKRVKVTRALMHVKADKVTVFVDV